MIRYGLEYTFLLSLFPVLNWKKFDACDLSNGINDGACEPWVSFDEGPIKVMPTSRYVSFAPRIKNQTFSILNFVCFAPKCLQVQTC
jgi:hypothetical protein